MQSDTFQFPSPSVVTEDGIVVHDIYALRTGLVWLFFYSLSHTFMCDIDNGNSQILGTELELPSM
jgi:hypothetical protein